MFGWSAVAAVGSALWSWYQGPAGCECHFTADLNADLLDILREQLRRCGPEALTAPPPCAACPACPPAPAPTSSLPGLLSLLVVFLAGVVLGAGLVAWVFTVSRPRPLLPAALGDERAVPLIATPSSLKLRNGAA